MKTKEQIKKMYLNAKNEFLKAKRELTIMSNTDGFTQAKYRTLADNIAFHGQNLKIMEAILEIPENERLMNSNKMSIEEGI